MSWTIIQATPGVGKGAGGGGGYSGQTGKGGNAGQFVEAAGVDVSAYTGALTLVVTVGQGGAGGVSVGSGAIPGSAGAAGQVIYSTQTGAEIPADVLPIRPTAVGSFSKAANATGQTVFPDLGPGVWVIDNGSADQYLYIGTLEIDDAGSTINLRSVTAATFIASKRPNITAGMNFARTIHYKFYSMTQWG